jgi:hypothetical protein
LTGHSVPRSRKLTNPTGKTHPLRALLCDQRAQRRALGRYRAWLETRTARDQPLEINA